MNARTDQTVLIWINDFRANVRFWH